MKVTVYSTPECPYCDMVKIFLKEHDVEFVEVNVREDHEKAKEMVEKTGQMSVPVTSIDQNGEEKVIVGFNLPELKKAFNIE